MGKTTSIGGQAVIDGVMMKGPAEYAVSVRLPDGSIRTEVVPYVALGQRYKVLGLPFIRGIVSFCESMYIGMKTLTYSADIGIEAENEQQEKPVPSWVNQLMTVGTVLLAVVLALGIFVVIPSLLGSLIGRFIRWTWVTNLFEGLIRMGIFILYVALIAQMKDIQTVFEYHGAEHKTINCYESEKDLTPEQALSCTRLHKRCGTSFMFLVMAISILLFMVVRVSNPWLRVLSRIVLIPVIAAVSYEVLKLSARSDNKLLNALVYPGLLLQKLTTREPNAEQLEVAIASFNAVLQSEQAETPA